MANRKVTQFPEIDGGQIVDQDILNLVAVFEVDPLLRNKKLTFSGLKAYLNNYYTIGATATAVTVAGLPGAPSDGQIARVTDASSPAAGAVVSGGGASQALVWYNGSAWKVFAT